MKNTFEIQARSPRHTGNFAAARHLVALICLLASFHSAFAQRHVPPPRPAVAPLIGGRYANDADGDRIDDGLLNRARRAAAAESAAVTAEQKSLAHVKVGEFVNVELIFKEPITQQQIDTFNAMGGEITYIYKAVSYGWNARIPLNKVSAVPAAMGATFVLLDEPKSGEAQLNLATRTGRVRPVWASGFAGNALGFSGNTNTTIAILDSGVDESHADLNGRKVFWHDYTSSNYVSPIDIFSHGSHVAGIALGSGASAGSGTGTLKITANGTLNGLANNKVFWQPMELPTNSLTVTATSRWVGGSANGTRLRWFQRLRTDPPLTWSGLISSVGMSPLALNFTFTPTSLNVYSPGLIQSNGITDYVITYQITNYPGVGDGFNKLRGVAAGCNWAGAKVENDAGGFTGGDLSAAIDDLVANRLLYKIKIMNLSLGGSLSGSVRQKINTAVNNGIIMAVAAGNSSVNHDLGAGIGTNFVSEPGRAAMALTVAASSSLNQLTDYSREGFYSPSSTSGQEEDYKPDLMAPGGSVYQAFITSIDSNSGDGPAFADQQTNDYRQDYGTSMATPFAAGCAALVIDAMEQSGVVWDFNSSQHACFVKMLLCATASESNTNREGANGLAIPTLQRAGSITNGSEVLPAGKDLAEGYGMINPDAAIEAVAMTYNFGTPLIVTSNTYAPTDRRVWARTVNLVGGRNLRATLAVTNGDFDLYLYSTTPSAYGTPVILASSAQAGTNVNEEINFMPDSDQTALLVVKRVPNFGNNSASFNLVGNLAPAISFAAAPTNGFAPLTVSFVNQTTGATNYNWTFGDGNISASANPINIYSNAGSYTVTLAATGVGGTNSLAVTNAITVYNLPTIAPPTLDGANLTFSFETAPSWNYIIEYADSLENPVWQVFDTVPGDGTVKTITAPVNSAPQRFLRLRVE